MVAGVCLGLVGGWALARFSQAPRRSLATEAGSPRDAADSETASLASVPVRSAEPESGRESVDAAPDDAEPPLVHPGLLRYAREGIAQGWLELRRNPIPDTTLEEGLARFERTVLDAPREIGRSLGQRENERDGAIEEFVAGDPLALLVKLGQGGVGPRPEFVSDGAGFARLFPAVAGAMRDGATNRSHPDDVLEDGSTLSFPAGVFRLRSLMQEKDPFPRDVTVRGAGMNATLLLVDELSTRGELRNFTLRDCTLFTEDYLFDLRQNPSSIQLDRVRVIGFDIGAGGSCMIGAVRPGTVLWARNSRLEGGYGRSPEHGTLWDVRTDAFLARLESCQVDLVSLELGRLQPGASVAFVNCTLTDLLDRPPIDTEHAGIVLAGTTVAYFDRTQGGAPHKDLDELFPNWRERIEE